MSKQDKPKTALDYNPGTTELPEGAFRISASQFSKFMAKPHEWYRETVLGEEGFTGSTASVLGTCVHYIAEMKGKGLEPDKAEIEQYIINHEDHPDVDTAEVRSQYAQMGMTLVNDYLRHNKNYRVEEFVSTQIGNFYPSGSCDAVRGSDDSACIVDYKTYNSKTKPKSIPMNYKYQLLIYAYIYAQIGVQVDRIRLVYVNRSVDGRYISDKTGKACGKIHPPEVTVLTEYITEEDYDFIESVLKLCAETTQLALDKPELAYMLFRDYRLKQEK